jgi:hypothetical protein
VVEPPAVDGWCLFYPPYPPCAATLIEEADRVVHTRPETSEIVLALWKPMLCVSLEVFFIYQSLKNIMFFSF